MIKAHYFLKYSLINHKESLNLPIVSKRYKNKGDLGIVAVKGMKKDVFVPIKHEKYVKNHT